eukprot:763379-Hanusia_phi.AAC.7
MGKQGKQGKLTGSWSCGADAVQGSTVPLEHPECLECREGTDTQRAATMLACVAMGTAIARELTSCIISFCGRRRMND